MSATEWTTPGGGETVGRFVDLLGRAGELTSNTSLTLTERTYRTALYIRRAYSKFEPYDYERIRSAVERALSGKEPR